MDEIGWEKKFKALKEFQEGNLTEEELLEIFDFPSRQEILDRLNKSRKDQSTSTIDLDGEKR